jgi:hypothetical protein
MLIFKLIWALFVRLFLGSVAFGFLLLLAYCAYLPDLPKINARARADYCGFVSQASFRIAGRNFQIPARNRTTLYFPLVFEKPNLVNRIDAEGMQSWEDNAGYFCEAELINQPDPEMASFEHFAARRLSQQLDLPSVDTIDRLTFGTTGFGFWLVPAPIVENAASPELLIETEDQLKIWQYHATAGWLPSGYRLSSRCLASPRHQINDCDVRVTRRSDGMVFEAWSLHIAEMPEANQPAPPEFLELVERLPKLLDLFVVQPER